MSSGARWCETMIAPSTRPSLRKAPARLEIPAEWAKAVTSWTSSRAKVLDTEIAMRAKKGSVKTKKSGSGTMRAIVSVLRVTS